MNAVFWTHWQLQRRAWHNIGLLDALRPAARQTSNLGCRCCNLLRQQPGATALSVNKQRRVGDFLNGSTRTLSSYTRDLMAPKKSMDWPGKVSTICSTACVTAHATQHQMACSFVGNLRMCLILAPHDYAPEQTTIGVSGWTDVTGLVVS